MSSQARPPGHTRVMSLLSRPCIKYASADLRRAVSSAGSVSLVAVLRDARNPSRRAPQVGHARLRMTCALLRTRIPTSETQYWRELALCGARRVYNEDAVL